jgi:hypothetical protein
MLSGWPPAKSSISIWMHSILPLNRGMILNYAASLSLWRGAVTVPSSVPPRTKPDVSAYDRPCLRFAQNAYAPMRSSFPQTSRAIGLFPVWCARSSSGTRIWLNRFLSTRQLPNSPLGRRDLDCGASACSRAFAVCLPSCVP